MAYLDEQQLAAAGFKRVGRGVKVSDRASIYDAQRIELGDYARIDDFCVVSGTVTLGNYCHVTPMCLVAGGEPGIVLGDFATLAYGVRIFAQSDDYSGETMVNSLVPRSFKNELFAPVSVGRQVIIGAGTVVFPGVDIAEGCAIGAMSLVNKSTLPWGIYVGSPARRIKERKKALLELEARFLAGDAQ